MSTVSQAPPFATCCKDMATALSFPAGRHLFIEDGKLQLMVAKTPLQGAAKPNCKTRCAIARFAASQRPT